jgi:hypothetical protein
MPQTELRKESQREEAPHSESDASRQGERNAMRGKRQNADNRVIKYSEKCVIGAREYDAVDRRFTALPDHTKGLMLEVFALVSIAAVLLEVYPARLAAYAFDVTDVVQLVVLTAGISILGWVIGLFLGDLAFRHRTPQERPAVHTISVTVALLAAVIYLLMGYELRLVYASIVAEDAKSHLLEPWLLALSLTGLSAIGLALGYLAGVSRESVERAGLRWKRARLRRELAANTRRLTAAREELRDCDEAYLDAFPETNPPNPVTGVPPSVQRRDGIQTEIFDSSPSGENHAPPTPGQAVTS